MARRRRRRKSSYEQPMAADTGSSQIALGELSPRARRLVEGGVIDLETVRGSGEGGSITSGDILHAARLMEVEQSVARIEVAMPASNGGADGARPDSELIEETPDPPQGAAAPMVAEARTEGREAPALEIDDSPEESATFTSVKVGGEPIEVEPSPWDDYNGSTDGFSDLAREGADQSWGEAEAHLAAMQGAAGDESLAGTEALVTDHQSDESGAPAAPQVTEPPTSEPATPLIAHVGRAIADVGNETATDQDESAIAAAEAIGDPYPREEMMDFGTLEHVDPESVWAQGAEDFAPWFLAHSQQLGAVLGLQAGLSDARQFTTKSATGVLGRDDNGEDVVVVSSKNAVADDSDLGRALGMAASSGAASVALVSAALQQDQLKALAWLNGQTRSGVKWYGIEMSVVRIADSPAAMLFDLVAAPGQQESVPDHQ